MLISPTGLTSVRDERVSDQLSITSPRPHRGPGTYQLLGKQVLNTKVESFYFRTEEPESSELRTLVVVAVGLEAG